MSLYNVNRLILVGNITQAPEIKNTQSGKSVCNVNIATNESVKQPDNTYRDIPTFHRVTLWGKTAEAAAKCSKGESVYVEARITYGKYEKDGTTHYTTTLTATKFISFQKKEPPFITKDAPTGTVSVDEIDL